MTPPGRYALDAVFDRDRVGHLRVRAGTQDLTLVVDTGG